MATEAKILKNACGFWKLEEPRNRFSPGASAEIFPRGILIASHDTYFSASVSLKLVNLS